VTAQIKHGYVHLRIFIFKNGSGMVDFWRSRLAVIFAFPAHSNEVLCIIDTNFRDGGEEEEDDDDESWRVNTIASLNRV